MSEELKNAVKKQFGAHAAGYSTSAVHARGQDLPLLPEIAGLNGSQEVLDVATATGNTALSLAPHARHVTGVDLTSEMIDEARRQAAIRGVVNVTFAEGDAEHLPFPDARFDVVTCRIAAHHFPNVGAFCREAGRVLKPGGMLLVVDNIAPEDPELDTFINQVEKLRDHSHFRAHRASEWQGYMEAAGLHFHLAQRFFTPIDREDWLARLGVTGDLAEQVRARLAEAPEQARQAFEITATHFTLHKAILLGRKP